MKASSLVFEAIGTKWQIDLYEKLDSSSSQNLRKSILDRIEVFDKTYSRFRQDSLVTKMSKESGEYTLPADSVLLFQMYQNLYQITDGSFTPLVGQALVDAGYDASYSLSPKKIRSLPTWDEAISFKDNVLTIKKPSILDFGAAGKGYLVDIVSRLLVDAGFTSFTVDAGGDIVHRGKSPVRIGLENPDNTTEVIGITTIKNQSICSSSGNRRAWTGFHHILDPHTLTSPTHILATWVIAKDAIIADAITTSLFFTSGTILKKHYEFEYLVLRSDHALEKSPGFSAEIFIP